MAKILNKFARSQLLVPISALVALVIFNLIFSNFIKHVNFFSITTVINNDGNRVLQGNLIDIFNNASELVIITIGMTLVTASSKGQDISVGAVAAIAGSVFMSVLRSNQITIPIVIAAFLAGCAVAIICGAFNGTLVSVFKIQPMVATLILFNAGRSIAYWINGGATPTVESPLIKAIGNFIPKSLIPTPIIIVFIFVVLVALVLRFTNLRLYTQAVGINERSARLNGISPVWIKLLTFMILGTCTAVAGSISVSRMQIINHETILFGIEMDAILAVAIGGNALGGGKFSLAGSVIGAYTIQTLIVTLYTIQVPSEAIRACKAPVVIAIVVLSSPITKKYILKLRDKMFKKPTRITENQ